MRIRRRTTFRPKCGTIGTWTLPSGRVVEATLRHRWAREHGQSRKVAEVELSVPLASMTEEEQWAVIYGRMGMELRQTLYLIEKPRGMYPGAYDPRQVRLLDYFTATMKAGTILAARRDAIPDAWQGLLQQEA